MHSACASAIFGSPQLILSAGFPAAFFNLSHFYVYFWLKSERCLSKLLGSKDDIREVLIRAARRKKCSKELLVWVGERCLQKLLNPYHPSREVLVKSCSTISPPPPIHRQKLR